MQLRDCVVKPADPGFWLYHTASSYRVRMDDLALRTLESLVAKTAADALSEPEALIFDRLSGRGMIEGSAGRGGVRMLRRSPLRTLDVELSSRCNLKCGHCFAALAERMMRRETLDRLLAGTEELEPVSLVLNGGEPLLNPIWRDAVAAGRERGMRVVIMTNGTVVTADAAAFMAAHRVAKVAVSLDGFEAQHDLLRGPRAFERTVAGIRRLVGAGLQVFVTTMQSDDTLARQYDFERFCLEDLGVAGIRYAAVVPIGKGKDAPASFLVGDAALAETHAAGRLQGDDSEPAASRRPGEKAWPCEAGVEQLFIGADGQVYACHYFQNLAEPLGDLGRATLGAIYRAAQAGAVAQRRSWRELPACQGCPALAVCQGGCRARARLLAGDISAPDPHACRIHR